MGKGSNTTTTVQQVPPQVLNNYQQAFNTAANVASIPYAPYQGQIVADLSPGQNYAIQNFAQPTADYQSLQPTPQAYQLANNYVARGAGTLNQSGTALGQSQSALDTAANSYSNAWDFLASNPDYAMANGAIQGVQPYLDQSNQYISGASPTIGAGLGTIAGAAPMVGNANNMIGAGWGTVAGATQMIPTATDTLSTGLGTIAGAQPISAEAGNTFATGLGTIGNAQPMVGQASNTIAGAGQNYGLSQQELLNSTAPIWNQTMQYNPNSINSFYSPYVNDVVNATEQQFNNQNAIQQQQVVGNAAAENAWGGDRSAIAQGITAGQQQAQEAPVIAGLENTGFTQAQQEFNAQQQAQLGALETTGWLTSQAGTGLAGLGTAQVGQGTAQLGAAQTQQGIGQAQLAGGAEQLAQAQTQQGIGTAQLAGGQAQLGAAQTQQGIGLAQGQLGQEQLGAAQTQQGIGQAQLAGAQTQLAQGQQAAGLAGIQTGVGQAYTNVGAGVTGQGQALAGIGAGQTGIAGAEQGITGQQIAQAGQYGNLSAQQTNANNAQVNYATQLYNAELGAINAGMSTGALVQAEQQAQLNVPYQIYTAGQAYPFQTSQFLTSAAEGLNPGGGTSTTTGPSPSPLSGVGGLLTGIAGIGGLVFPPSDERVKEDIEKIGTADPKHGGGNIYSFRYKGDPITHIGQMAQEVERRRPDAVHEDPSGLKRVDYHAATEARKAGGRIDPAHGAMPIAVAHGIKPALGLGPRHRMRLAAGGEVIPSGILGWRQGEQKFQSGGMPQPTIPGMPIPGMTGSMASPISPVLPSTKIPDLTISIVPPPSTQGGHGGPGPPTPPTVNAGNSAASSSISQIGPAMSAIGSFASTAQSWFGGGNNFGGGASPNVNPNPTINNLAASGFYSAPNYGGATSGPGFTGSAFQDFARGGATHYDDGGNTPPDTMADALAMDPGSGIGTQDIAPPPGMGLGSVPMAASTSLPQSVADYIRQGAVNRGIDPNAALHTVATEGGTGKFKLGDSGSSGGPFQLHLDDPNNPGAGKSMGDAFYRDTHLNPLDPQNWQRTVDYSLDYAKAHGGFDPNIWHGLRQSSGISPQQPVQLASADGAQVYTLPDTPRGIAGMPTGANLVEQTAEGKPSGLDALRAKGVDPWLALAIAGFATAAGRSPFPMQNIGAGMLEGAKYIQQQTAAYPEQQLHRAQAGLYQTEADLYRAQIDYNPESGLPGLTNRIDSVARQINKEPSPKDTAQPLAPLPTVAGAGSPTPTAQPATGPTGAPVSAAASAPSTMKTVVLPNAGAVPAPQPGYEPFDNMYRQFDAQLRAAQNSPYPYQQKQQMINAVTTQLRDAIAKDPRYVAQSAATTAAATSPIEIQKAIAQRQGESDIALRQKAQEVAMDNAATAEKGQISGDQEHISKELLPAAQKASENIGTSQLIHDTMQSGVSTGFGANWKLEAGRVLTALGASDDQVKAFTGTNLPAGQELEKLFLQQAAGAVRTMGAREPGSVISLFRNAYPNLETDPRAINLMQNVLYMQGKQAQDHYNLARAHMDSAVSAMQQPGQHYSPLSSVEKDFTSDTGPRSANTYLRAAQIMSGDVKGWAGTTKDQRMQILSLIPPGHQVVNQKGETGYAPMPGTPAPGGPSP